jgi:hypothetical protein
MAEELAENRQAESGGGEAPARAGAGFGLLGAIADRV